MGILSNTYESELDVQVLAEDVERMWIFHEQCASIFDNKWSAEAMLTRHLSDELAARTNKRLIEQIQHEMFATMPVPAELLNPSRPYYIK